MILALLASWAFAADSAVVLQLRGEVVEMTAGRPVGPFERLPEGASVEVRPAAVVQVVYESNGRIERWSGPAAFTLGAGASVPSLGTAIVSVWSPPGIAIGGQALGAAMGGDMRGAHTLVRGDGPALSSTDAEDLVTLAHERYAARPAPLGDDDVTAELALAAALIAAGDQAGAALAIEAARRRCPECAGLPALRDELRDTK